MLVYVAILCALDVIFSLGLVRAIVDDMVDDAAMPLTIAIELRDDEPTLSALLVFAS